MIAIEIQKLKTEVIAKKLDHLQETFKICKAEGICTESISKEILFLQEIFAIRMWDYIAIATRKGNSHE